LNESKKEQYVLYDQHRKETEKQLDGLMDETKRIEKDKNS
jgi:hypothetical protein